MTAPSFSSLVASWQARRPWETPEAHGARLACARELEVAIGAAEQDVDGKVEG